MTPTSFALRLRQACAAGFAWLACAAFALPAFAPEDLGTGVPIDINAAGAILGLDSFTGTRPWVLADSGRAYLPLPGGTASVKVRRIGPTGVVVGQIGSQAAVWWRDGGNHTLELLPFPPGATIGRAAAVNGAETVLVSYGTPVTLATGLTVWSYRPWLYRRGGVLIDLGAQNPGMTTFAEAVDLSDGGRVLLQSGEILEPGGGVTATPPFPDPSPGGMHWLALRAARLNDAGSFVGVAVLATSLDYAQVVRHTPGQGWTVLGGLSLKVYAAGIDAAGDALLMANYVCPLNYGLAYNAPGVGTFCLDDLVKDGGRSFTSLSSRGALAPTGPGGSLNGAIAAFGYSAAAGTYRLARLLPAGDLARPPAVSLKATPHPGTWVQPYDAITLEWTSAGPLAKA